MFNCLKVVVFQYRTATDSLMHAFYCTADAPHAIT